jgi:hypothetical protein
MSAGLLVAVIAKIKLLVKRNDEYSIVIVINQVKEDSHVKGMKKCRYLFIYSMTIVSCMYLLAQ